MTVFDTPGPVSLSIEVSRGLIHVVATDRQDIVVSVAPSDAGHPADVEASSKTTVELVNGTLSIRMPKPGGIAAPVIGWKRSGSVNVEVELPEGSSLRADTGVAEVGCEGRLGDVDVKTGAGDVRLDRTATVRVHSGIGRFSLEESSGSADITTAGEISIGAVAGGVTAKNVNGRTWIGRAGSHVKVKSANGDVTIDEAGGDVTVKTANGSIRIGEVARGSTTIESAAGTLEIGIREGTAAWIDANTRFGRIHNGLSPTDGHESSQETVQVHARTAFGDVLITRS